VTSDQTRVEIERCSAAPKLSPEEQDYVCSLPITERPLAIYGLQTANMYYSARFLLFLRSR